MNFKAFMHITIGSTLLAWGVGLFLLLSIDPVFAGLVELSLFYLAVFVALTGTLLALAVAVRVRMKPDIILFRHVATSFRQAVLLSILVIMSLLLLSKNLFTWWSMFLLIILLSLIEWNAQSLRRKRPLVTEQHNASNESL